MLGEMIYTNKRHKAKVLLINHYKDYEYVILSLGTHPCAYIIVDNDNKLYGMEYDDIHEQYDIRVHGGFTYSKDTLSYLEFSPKYDALIKSKNFTGTWVIGWDYAHSGDSYGLDDIIGGKKWSTGEIIRECEDVINQIIEINKG